MSNAEYIFNKLSYSTSKHVMLWVPIIAVFPVVVVLLSAWHLIEVIHEARSARMISSRSVDDTDAVGFSVHTALSARDVFCGYVILRQEQFQKLQLTEQEQRVASRVLLGESINTASKKLFLSSSAVKYHLHNIYAKAECANKEAFLRNVYAGMGTSSRRWFSRKELEEEAKECLSKRD